MAVALVVAAPVLPWALHGEGYTHGPSPGFVLLRS